MRCSGRAKRGIEAGEKVVVELPGRRGNYRSKIDSLDYSEGVSGSRPPARIRLRTFPWQHWQLSAASPATGELKAFGTENVARVCASAGHWHLTLAP